jgi:nucleolar MIF4G domain-containing protein 1
VCIDLLCVTEQYFVAADEHGRWWVVGSAWTGSLPGKTGKQGPNITMKVQESNVYSQKLLDLARKHRMNTDVRKNIFCILMTAEVMHKIF